ncbi:hypothetical protein F3Y22_tig00110482pilonHSYRG00566 [Hibiscus syriacus]|uniref:Uncharacterized protein n=1 Tax=Hibiscus syriacus TaxID=106335 RepID=A0A6A3ADH9_HIBSY|nr:hypothetical protein F3Y22_tig00110482pilonHSYRG00566 [Hibiscus syriacus]
MDLDDHPLTPSRQSLLATATAELRQMGFGPFGQGSEFRVTDEERFEVGGFVGVRRDGFGTGKVEFGALGFMFPWRIWLKLLESVFQLLESNRSSNSVRNTAAATFRQALALVCDSLLIFSQQKRIEWSVDNDARNAAVLVARSGWKSMLGTFSTVARGFLLLQQLGNLPMAYLVSVLDVYEVLQKTPTYIGNIIQKQVLMDMVHLAILSLSLAAVATVAATPAGCVVSVGSLLISATFTPSASPFVAALSDCNFSVACLGIEIGSRLSCGANTYGNYGGTTCGSHSCRLYCGCITPIYRLLPCCKSGCFKCFSDRNWTYGTSSTTTLSRS